VSKLLEHPTITKVNQLGYLEQEEHAGTDFFGDEILSGDDVAICDGEMVLKENLERFLSEHLGFEFKTIY
jgi:hypothetical protein